MVEAAAVEIARHHQAPPPLLPAQAAQAAPAVAAAIPIRSLSKVFK